MLLAILCPVAFRFSRRKKQIMFSIIIPTVGRHSLERTLRSIRHLTRDDEVLVISDGKQPVARAICQVIRPKVPFRLRFFKGPKTNNWGNEQRNLGMDKARNYWLMFMDDDDIFTPDAFFHVRRVLAKGHRKPHIFRMLNFDRQVLWSRRKLMIGNVSTQMFVIPDKGDLLGRWPTHKEYAGDAHFFGSLIKKWPKKSIVWRKEVISILRPQL